MKDPRFLPVEYQEPVDESEGEFFEAEEELYDDIVLGGKGNVKKFSLYIAS